MTIFSSNHWLHVPTVTHGLVETVLLCPPRFFLHCANWRTPRSMVHTRNPRTRTPSHLSHPRTTISSYTAILIHSQTWRLFEGSLSGCDWREEASRPAALTSIRPRQGDFWESARCESPSLAGRVCCRACVWTPDWTSAVHFSWSCGKTFHPPLEGLWKQPSHSGIGKKKRKKKTYSALTRQQCAADACIFTSTHAVNVQPVCWKKQNKKTT